MHVKEINKIRDPGVKLATDKLPATKAMGCFFKM